MPNSAVITDQQVTAVLGSYAAMVDRVLSNPQRWLGMDEDPPPCAPFPARAFDAVRDRAFGEQTPASPTWYEGAGAEAGVLVGQPDRDQRRAGRRRPPLLRCDG